MIASVIFVIVSLGFTYGFLSSYSLQFTASRHYTANFIARNRIQHAVILGFDNIWAMGESNVTVNADGGTSNTGLYTRSTSIDTNYSANCIMVTVDVNFPTMQGMSPAPVTMSTLLTEGL